MSEKQQYEQHEIITKELLDSIKVGDLVKVNDWKNPMRVKGVSENYFVMARKVFGSVIYSVCEKIPWPGIMYNAMRGGMFHVGRDSWVFGWGGWGLDSEYDFDNAELTAAYLQSFEDADEERHSELSCRNAMPIYTLQIKRCANA